MKPAYLTIGRILAIAFVASIPVTLLAFQQKDKQSFSPQKIKTDTIPAKKETRERKIIDLDEVLDDVDRIDLDIDLKNLHIDLSEIGPEIEQELAEAKIEIEQAVKEIDRVKINEEINAALKEIDVEKIQDEVKETIAKIDWDEIHDELEKVKEINLDEVKQEMEKVEKELKNMKPKLEKELANVKKQVEKVKVEMKEYKNFIDDLESDGLISKKGEYSIKHRNGELIINGKTQPAAVYNKYRSFLEKHKALTIEKSDDNFHIDHDDDNDQ